MAPNTTNHTIDELLKLPPAERIEIALALWESLEDAERDSAFELTPELKSERDRRWA
jgi:putative addiction module component (TIGR02574 family)